jgi:DNA topoisomerase-1
VAGHRFIAQGKRTLKPGWMSFYEPYVKFTEQVLPDLEVGQVLRVLKLDLLAKETQPPNRYTQASIIREMEKRGLGTRATRAEILQKLYDRGYIRGKSIEVTDLGKVVAGVLNEFCPRILDEKLTRHFEQEMEAVFSGKKKRKEVITEAKAVLADILAEFKQNETDIGKKLLDGFVAAKRAARTLGSCPKCEGELRVRISRRTRKRFVGCTSWPKCDTAYPLPQFGTIVPLRKTCPVCGLPTIRVMRGKKRPFTMCINHLCKTKDGWGRPTT